MDYYWEKASSVFSGTGVHVSRALSVMELRDKDKPILKLLYPVLET